MLKKLFGQTTAQTSVTPEEVERRRAGGEELVVLDVRQPDEYRSGHVPGSTLIPLDQLALRLAEVPKDRLVVAMCHAGSRSRAAVSLLQRAGFSNIADLQGGMSAWEQQRLPVERGT